MPAPVSGGRLAGLVDVAASIADRRAALDALAADFATTVNDWSAAGLDANGAAGRATCSTRAAARPRCSVAGHRSRPDRGRHRRRPAERQSARARRGPRLRASWRSAGAAIVSANARQLASAKAEAAASAAWRDHSRAALDEVTGVDLDREAADLLRYQQAYNASARIIQVARETIDALFAAL